MADASYRTQAGGRIDLTGLTTEEAEVLAEVRQRFLIRPPWEEFARAWPPLAAKAWGDAVPVGCPLYRVCQDLELRLGVAEGRIARPDYRDRLAELIEERFESRYAFCKATGIDQGNLSRVLAGRSHLSPDMMARALDALGLQLELAEREPSLLDPFESESQARVRDLERRVATLEELASRARRTPATRRAALIGATRPGDHMDGLRARLERGERFDPALRAELQQALTERARLTKELAAEAEERRRSHARAS